MAHGYRTLQHWNEWLAQQYLGHQLLDAEYQLFLDLFDKYFGKHVLLIGVPQQQLLLKSTLIPCQTLITPLVNRDKTLNYIESDFHELPILAGSVDLVILPHTLELVNNPRHLLAEACRVIKPEGLIAICGFNPYSMWGLQKLLMGNKKTKIAPWSANFIYPRNIKNWLKLAEFGLEKETSTFFMPPMEQTELYKKFNIFEKFGKRCFPVLGGVYVLLARAKVIPLTPIRLKWKQKLSDIRISSTISGHIARQSK